MKKQRMGGKQDTSAPVKGQHTPWPEDARPNHLLPEEQYDPFSDRATCQKKIDAHSRGIGGMALHAKK
jgi:hypothetical protein